MYMLRKKIKDAAQMKDINETVLAKLMILEYKSPSLFGEIYQDLNPKNGKSSKIKKYENAEKMTYRKIGKMNLRYNGYSQAPN